MFLGLEVEQRMRGLTQQVGNAEIQRTEVLVDAIAFCRCVIGNQAPVHGGCVQTPASKLRINGMFLHITIVAGCLEHVFDQLSPFGVFPLRDLAGACAVAPEGGRLYLP
ncbi:hypothetical protein D9M70_526420 [compost metagenome]